MRGKNKKTLTVFFLFLTLFVSGCNLFDAIDSGLNSKSAGDLISEGEGNLAEANYSTALDRFQRALDKENTDRGLRGRASAYAGLAGFNMFSILNSLQNEVVAPNSSAAVFQAAKNVTSLENLNKAIDDMASINEPSKDDLLLRGLMASVSAAKTIIAKYDTNLNSALDNPDQINFTTNDKKIKTWESFYSDISSKNSPYSLEKAYIDLATALDGRGSTWTVLSPFYSVEKVGTYTKANSNTVEAVGRFALKLKEANIKYNNSVNEFKAIILELDGAK